MKSDAYVGTVSAVASVAVILSAAAIGVGLTLLVAGREHRTAEAVASRRLTNGTQITAGDLETEEAKPLIGRFLTRDAEPGQAVSLAMTSKYRLPEMPNTLAALITITAGSLVLTNGAPVDIVRGNDVVTSGTILDWSCGKLDCTVLVGLAAAKAGVDSLALSNARLRSASPPSAVSK